jgi:LPS-assembly lipoprotein
VRARLARRAAPLVLLALGGCGFHLQGLARLPPAFATTRLDAEDRYTDFHRALSDALATAGSHVVGRGADPAVGATVEVLKDDSGQHVLSVSSTNTPTEYEVYYTIRYRVRVGDREAIPAQTLTLTRDYSFAENALLGKEHEQDVIRGALAHDLAALVVRRLAALSP